MTIPEIVVEACARASHEVNRAYCLALGDATQPPWEDAPPWQRESAQKGVPSVLAGSTPEQSHQQWLAERGADGWKHGPVKDVAKKEHPGFVPYADLPEAQRVKNDLYVTTVRAMATALGVALR